MSDQYLINTSKFDDFQVLLKIHDLNHYYTRLMCHLLCHLGKNYREVNFDIFFDVIVKSSPLLCVCIMKENGPGQCGTIPVDTQSSTSRTTIRDGHHQ